ncbi:hypothetical protein O6H91_23G051700 [Diphasiastrum complanatum]|uniref:Uncharacterized protein n=1 Tax=Diphasiastrum complanatum TaxID=34168 RepID=A0ACC2AAQ2_DIPCM|nr:hypothetical protein O6H91_23G051700 [Diphasiastrum complanatum]
MWYLDTDVGQPEFTVPGCLSLHILQEPIIGSPILHLHIPEKSYFYGDISPKDDPTQFIAAFRTDMITSAFSTMIVSNKHNIEEHPICRFWQNDDNKSKATKLLSIEIYTDCSVAQSHSFYDGFSCRHGKNAVELRALRIMACFRIAMEENHFYFHFERLIYVQRQVKLWLAKLHTRFHYRTQKKNASSLPGTRDSNPLQYQCTTCGPSNDIPTKDYGGWKYFFSSVSRLWDS